MCNNVDDRLQVAQDGKSGDIVPLTLRFEYITPQSDGIHRQGIDSICSSYEMRYIICK